MQSDTNKNKKRNTTKFDINSGKPKQDANGPLRGISNELTTEDDQILQKYFPEDNARGSDQSMIDACASSSERSVKEQLDCQWPDSGEESDESTYSM